MLCPTMTNMAIKKLTIFFENQLQKYKHNLITDSNKYNMYLLDQWWILFHSLWWFRKFYRIGKEKKKEKNNIMQWNWILSYLLNYGVMQ